MGVEQEQARAVGRIVGEQGIDTGDIEQFLPHPLAVGKEFYHVDAGLVETDADGVGLRHMRRSLGRGDEGLRGDGGGANALEPAVGQAAVGGVDILQPKEAQTALADIAVPRHVLRRTAGL